MRRGFKNIGREPVLDKTALAFLREWGVITNSEHARLKRRVEDRLFLRRDKGRAVWVKRQLEFGFSGGTRK